MPSRDRSPRGRPHWTNSGGVVEGVHANAQMLTLSAVREETRNHKDPLPHPRPVQDKGLGNAACGLSGFAVAVKVGILGSVAQNT
jgi:hypothetical protein